VPFIDFVHVPRTSSGVVMATVYGLQLMTSVADDRADVHLQQESYLNDRCAYLTEQLAQHRAQLSTRTRSVSTSDDGDRLRQKQAPVNGRQRHASAQVINASRVPAVNFTHRPSCL